MSKRTLIWIAGLCVAAILGGCESKSAADSAAAVTTEDILYISSDETSASKDLPQEAPASQEEKQGAIASGEKAGEASGQVMLQDAEKQTESTGNADASGEVQGQDMDGELEQVEEQARAQMEKLQKAVTQLEMNEASDALYQLWDQELNTLWSRLKKSLSEEEMSELTARQREWIAFKEEAGRAAGSGCEGGSIHGMIVRQKEAELTRERVYELADMYFGSQMSPDASGGQTGQTDQFISDGDAQKADEGEEPFAGSYADTQGTEDVYSELIVTRQGGGIYEVEIGLYRLTTLEGTAKAEGEILSFEDDEMQVKGRIELQDGGAVFTVTEPGFVYLYPGDVFRFPTKQ